MMTQRETEHGATERSPGERSEPGRSGGAPCSTPQVAGPRPVPAPDPEVRERPVRRRFAAEYKLRILEEAERCFEAGEVGALLRREGLYFSHLSKWREQRRNGSLAALQPRRRGPKAKHADARDRRIAELEREKERLARRLRQAELIIEVQRKASELLGIPLSRPGSGDVD
jgi:transposase